MGTPDFKQWAINILAESFSTYEKKDEYFTAIRVVSKHLEDSFDQGVAFGRRSNDKTDKYEGVF